MAEQQHWERERPSDAPSDTDLLDAIGRRDQAALEAVYARYGGLVYTLALRIVGDPHLAQEILQDVLLRCWDHAASFQTTRGSLAAWLLGVTRNRAIDLLRGRQHQARLREREPLPLLTADVEAFGRAEVQDVSDSVVLRQTVRAALDALPADHRQAIELAYYGGLAPTEIARLMGVPPATVKRRLRAGLQRLRRLLQPAIGPKWKGRKRRG